jgi:hypothetical protein
MRLSGIEITTFRLVTQGLKQLRHRVSETALKTAVYIVLKCYFVPNNKKLWKLPKRFVPPNSEANSPKNMLVSDNYLPLYKAFIYFSSR